LGVIWEWERASKEKGSEITPGCVDRVDVL